MAVLIVSFILAILLVLFVYVCITPNISSETFVLSKESSLDPNLQKALNFLGGDIAALLPEGVKKQKRQNRKLKRLFVTSGNPWGVTASEFLVIQVFLGLGSALIASLGAFVLANSISPILLGILGLILVVIGFQYPVIYYKSIADDRIKAFKRELPEAIDFLVIAMGGGSYSLSTAIEKVIKYLPEGVMRQEFSRIVSSMNSGKSLATALDEFGYRAPTEGIHAFVNSLNNASKLSAPVIEILKNRSDASRKELNAEIDKKIATLSTKVLLVFGPMSYISILLVVIAPVASSLTQLL